MTLKTRHFQWTELVIDSDMPAMSKYLCLYLATFMNAKTDMAWPSLKRMEHETNLTTPTILKYLDLAEEHGYLSIEHGDRIQSNKYYSKLPNAVKDTINAVNQGAKTDIAPSRGVLKSVGEGTKICTEKVLKDVKSNKQENKQKNKQGALKRRAQQIKEDYWPEQELLLKAREEYPDLELGTETEKFKNYYMANGKPMKNWDACWRNWIINANKFAQTNNRGTRQ